MSMHVRQRPPNHLPNRIPARRAMAGISLPSILIGLTLGLTATLLAAQLLLTARTAYAAIAEDTLMVEKGQQALDLLMTQIRQAGWSNTGWPQTLPAVTALARCEQAQPGAMPVCTTASPASNDILQIRYAGSGTRDDPSLSDDLLTDCSGQGVPAVRLPDDVLPAGLSLFYIGRADDGEPQLLCRYPSRRDGRMINGEWTSRSLIRGVEHMRLRFALDDNGDGVPDRTLEADAMGTDPALWQRVSGVEIALVIRADRRSATGPIPELILFRDPERRFVPRDAPQRLRRVFNAVVQLRNPPPCQGAPC